MAGTVHGQGTQAGGGGGGQGAHSSQGHTSGQVREEGELVASLRYVHSKETNVATDIPNDVYKVISILNSTKYLFITRCTCLNSTQIMI